LQTQEAADTLSVMSREEQSYLLDWTARVASTNIPLAYEFLTRAVVHLDTMDSHMIEAWALHAMDCYDRSGLRAAMVVIQDLERFIADSHERAAGAVLSEVEPVLLPFVRGLAGRRLKLVEGEAAWTDSETIYLPPLLARLPDSDGNFRLYKATAAILWAQTRYGTFRLPLHELMRRQSQPERFIALFHALETRRLQSCIARELPGLWRDMQAINRQLEMEVFPHQWQRLAPLLSDPGMDARQVLHLAGEYLHDLPLPPPLPYQGELHPEAVAAATAARVEREKALLRVRLSELLAEQREVRLAAEGGEPQRFSLRETPDSEQAEGMALELLLDDVPLAPPESVRNLMTSIHLDLGEIPNEYLTPAGPGEYDPVQLGLQQRDPDEVWQGTYHEEGAVLYNEWDHARQHFRKNWCVMREKPVPPVYDDFVRDTLIKYSGLIKQLRKTFEAMRDEDRLLKRQADGEEVDIDALVEALADTRDGSEMSERLFTRMHRAERNIAVVFMVDMSGSTKGWINDAERESLILLCEALETLGDSYAIYGFSGTTRKRCELYTVKTFDDPYNDEVRARISGIRPQDYTRMGFAIRHLSKILREAEARTRILITLSDGKPDDYSDYRGEYGIEDTRHALLEARRDGIHSYCITIDEQAGDYLPHMYGPAAYTVVGEVRQLPFKVSDIYRRLTT
jgi:nitric oxide reductase NorD protein